MQSGLKVASTKSLPPEKSPSRERGAFSCLEDFRFAFLSAVQAAE